MSRVRILTVSPNGFDVILRTPIEAMHLNYLNVRNQDGADPTPGAFAGLEIKSVFRMEPPAVETRIEKSRAGIS